MTTQGMMGRSLSEKVSPERRSFDPLWRNLLVIAPLFLVNAAGAAGNALFFVILILMTLKSSEGTVKALSLMYLAMVGNTALVTTGTPVFSLGKYLFLLACSMRFFLSLRQVGVSPFSHRVTLPLLMFSLVSLMLAVEGGYYVPISVLKLVSFTVGMLAIWLGAEAMRYRAHRLDSWFIAMILFIAVIGVLAYAAGLGYNAKLDVAFGTRFFNGPFYHPNTLGPAAGLIVLYLLSYGVLTRYTNRRLVMFLIPVFLWFSFMSSSRTSILAIALAFIIAMMTMVFMHKAALKKMLRVLRLGMIVGAVLIFTALMAELAIPGSVVDPVLDFLIKSSDAQQQFSTEAILASRASKIEDMLVNIWENPWTGIGFGTSTDPGFVYRATLLSAPVEKGNIVLAVVEETGAIGVVFFVVFLLAMGLYCIETGNIPGLMIFAGLFSLNLTEATMFAFGGPGGFFWIWVLAGLILGKATESGQSHLP